MKVPRAPTGYGELIRHSHPQDGRSPRPPEAALDELVAGLKEREQRGPDPGASEPPDPVQQLRKLTAEELVPTITELAEKYSKSGISVQMDASNFLDGGRELDLEFAVGDFRTELHGTVTNEAIAFHETRYTPEVDGELVSGPMLRLRRLDKTTFRGFVCERLAILVRAAVRRR